VVNGSIMLFSLSGSICLTVFRNIMHLVLLINIFFTGFNHALKSSSGGG
jgi:hypothetical protein